MSTMPLQFPSWLDQISYGAISPKGAGGNRLLSVIAKATEFSLDDKEKIKNLTDDKDSAFLAAGPEGQLMLFHHPTNFGGKIARPENKIVALNGLNHDAKVLEIEGASLCEATRFKAPLESILLGFSSLEEIRAFSFDHQKNGEMVKFFPAILLPPYIIAAAMSFLKAGRSMEPLELIPVFAKAAKDFDASYEGDGERNLEESAEARKNVGELLQFLWGLENKKLNKVSIKVDTEDEEVKAYLLALKA